MAFTSEIFIVIYDTAIARMSLPGGQTYQWVVGKRRRVENLSKQLVGKRTGDLMRSIHGTYEASPPKHVIVEVVADEDYAIFHHEGFRPKQMPPGEYMSLPAWPPWSARRISSHSGYSGNRFLSNALDAVMRDL